MIQELLKQGWIPCQLDEENDYHLRTIGRFKLYSCFNENFLVLVDIATNQTIGLDCSNLNHVGHKQEVKKIISKLKKYYGTTQQLKLL